MPRIYTKRSDNFNLSRKISACKRVNKPIDDIERFWSYVEINGFFDCWEWNGHILANGYGQFLLNGKQDSSHRVAYKLYHGKITEGMYICHRCHNRKCCNPFHLHEGTQQENMNDMKKANRQARMIGTDNGRAKLTEKQVIEIRNYDGDLSQYQLGKLYDVSHGTIWKIKHNKLWTCV